MEGELRLSKKDADTFFKAVFEKCFKPNGALKDALKYHKAVKDEFVKQSKSNNKK